MLHRSTSAGGLQSASINADVDRRMRDVPSTIAPQGAASRSSTVAGQNIHNTQAQSSVQPASYQQPPAQQPSAQQPPAAIQPVTTAGAANIVTTALIPQPFSPPASHSPASFSHGATSASPAGSSIRSAGLFSRLTELSERLTGQIAAHDAEAAAQTTASITAIYNRLDHPRNATIATSQPAVQGEQGTERDQVSDELLALLSDIETNLLAFFSLGFEW